MTRSAFRMRMISTYQNHTKRLPTMICCLHQKKGAHLMVAIMDHQVNDLSIHLCKARPFQSHLTQAVLKNREILVALLLTDIVIAHHVMERIMKVLLMMILNGQFTQAHRGKFTITIKEQKNHNGKSQRNGLKERTDYGQEIENERKRGKKKGKRELERSAIVSQGNSQNMQNYLHSRKSTCRIGGCHSLGETMNIPRLNERRQYRRMVVAHPLSALPLADLADVQHQIQLVVLWAVCKISLPRAPHRTVGYRLFPLTSIHQLLTA